MVNVDELNEEIKQFGKVVEKMDELPAIYEKVQTQLDACRDATNELRLAKEDMEKFIASTKQELEHQQNETISKITSIESSLEQKFDKMELNIRDRFSLTESNITLALNELKSTVEKSTADLNQKLDTEVAEIKKRTVIIAIGIGVAIILSIIKFFV